MDIGKKLYTIRGRKIVEHKVVQSVTTKTEKGEQTDYYVQNSGALFAIRKINLDNLGDYFHRKDEAEHVIDILNKYT